MSFLLYFLVDQVFSSDCLSIPQSLCLDEGSYIIGPEANEDSLIGYWSFDGTDTSDHTSNSNAMTLNCVSKNSLKCV